MKKVNLLIIFFLSTFTASFAQQTGEQIFNLLTGGAATPNGKTWVMSSENAAHRLGRLGDTTGGFYSYPLGLDESFMKEGLLNNSYTFRFDSIYIPENQNVTVNYLYADLDFGFQQAQFADTAITDPLHVSAPFKFVEDNSINNNTGYRIDIQNKSYIGYYQRRYSYYIAKITVDNMMLCQKYDDQNGFDAPETDTLQRCMNFVTIDPTVAGVDPGSFYNNGAIIFPNPASSELNFLNVNTFSIFNSLGIEIMKGSTLKTNIEHLLPGQYVVRLTDKNGKVTLKHFSKE